MYIIILYYYALNNYLVCFYFLLYQPLCAICCNFNAHKDIAIFKKNLMANAEMKEKV